MGRTDNTTATLPRDLEHGGSRGLVESFLFLAFRADAPMAATSRHALGDVDEVQFRRGPAFAIERIQAGSTRTLVLGIPDQCISGTHARIIQRAGSEPVLEDVGSKNGTRLDGRRVSSSPLANGSVIEIGGTFLVFKKDLPIARDGARDYVVEPEAAPSLSTLSPVLGRTYHLLGEVATSTIPVLIRGETGSGKDVVATALHRMSGRNGSFVPVNCGAIPATLVESELFGFRRGSFSGAVEDRLGYVRAANTGTLFLDEVGDLPASAQAALLRVLQDRKVAPLGSVSYVDVDFRLVSATHRDLDDLVGRGLFREDFLARLNGFSVRLPTLRERKEDIGLLVAQLLAGSRAAHRLTFSPESVRALFAHGWPENVRELERRLTLAVALTRDGCIEKEYLFGLDGDPPGNEMRTEDRASAKPPASRETLSPLEPEDAARRDQIVALLKHHHGNVTAVANAMGKARAQVQRWMRRYGVDRRAAARG